MNDLPASVAVFGPGLMGGSLLMALRERSPRTKLGAWARRPGVVAELESRGLIDFGGLSAEDVAAQSDLAVLCLPVDRLAGVAGAIHEALPPDAVVTDVGSVKQPVVEELEKIHARGAAFVGSHPMCGSEEAGLGAARADLYRGAVCVVTPTPQSRPEAVRMVAGLWRAVGARTLEMDPAEHDRAAAVVSHVPHVAAALLVELVRGEDPRCRDLCAGGFRDTTRIASGSPELWSAILSSNRREVAASLRKFGDSVAAVREALEKNDVSALRGFLESAAAHRAGIMAVS